jgi:hypothetical protein
MHQRVCLPGEGHMSDSAADVSPEKQQITGAPGIDGHGGATLGLL